MSISVGIFNTKARRVGIASFMHDLLFALSCGCKNNSMLSITGAKVELTIAQLVELFFGIIFASIFIEESSGVVLLVKGHNYRSQTG